MLILAATSSETAISWGTTGAMHVLKRESSVALESAGFHWSLRPLLAPSWSPRRCRRKRCGGRPTVSNEPSIRSSPLHPCRAGGPAPGASRPTTSPRPSAACCASTRGIWRYPRAFSRSMSASFAHSMDGHVRHCPYSAKRRRGFGAVGCSDAFAEYDDCPRRVGQTANQERRARC